MIEYLFLGCDSYMALAVLTPDTDCDMPCVANTTELCGAGNRLAIYVQTTAPPITPTACLGLGNPFNFDLVAVFVPASPGASVSAPVLLGSIELAAEEEQPSTLVLGVSIYISSCGLLLMYVLVKAVK